MPLPNFIIAGAPKCGTSALWRNLNDHPQIYLSKFKEPKFFTRYGNDIDDNILRPGPNRLPNFDRGITWYKKLFNEGIGIKRIGEASTVYMSMPDSPLLIRSHIPDVKIIFIVRDPVKRMYSHYWQDYKVGIKLKSFEQMVAEDDPGYRYYKYVSHYKTHLQRYYKLFEPDQIKVILFDDLKSDPQNVYSCIFEFLDVDSSYSVATSRKAVNSYSVPKIRELESGITQIANLPYVRKLPSGLRRLFRNIIQVVSKMNNTAATYPELSNELYKELSKEFIEDVVYIEEITGRKLDTWK